MTNSSLILAQRILDVFDQAVASLTEQEAALEVALVIVRGGKYSTAISSLADEPDSEESESAL